MYPSRARGLWPALFLLSGCLGVPSAGPSLDKPAPVLEGADALGQSIRLSDYHGKVVLLDFWRTG